MQFAPSLATTPPLRNRRHGRPATQPSGTRIASRGMLPPNATCARQTMAFSLIDDDAGAVPVAVVSKAGLAAWREKRGFARARLGGRDRVHRRGRQAGAGAGRGRAARPRAGRHRRRRGGDLGRSPGFPETLPPGVPPWRAAARGPIRAGWRSAGRSAPIRSTCTARKRKKAGRGWSGRRAPIAALVERLAGGDLPGARPDQHAGLRHGAGRTGRRGDRGRREHWARGTGSSSATSCSPRTIRRSTPSAAPARGRRGWSTSSGATTSAPKVTLVGKGVCFDTGGLDLKPASGMKMMKKDMGGAAIMLGLAQAIMAAQAAGAAARAVAAGRERGVRQRDAAARHRADAQGSDRRDRQHRRRGPADPVRRAGRGLRPRSRRC